MWLYFNSNGQLETILEHGTPARVGTTKFSIFAVFENLNEDNIQDCSATIKLKKPDLTGSSYPVLLMQSASSTFQKLSSETNTEPFRNGTTYYGFLFDFGNFNTDEEEEILLDTNGLWEATITLIKDDYDVQGVATFNVGGTGTEDEVTISYDIIINQMVKEINKKAAKNQVIIVVNNIQNVNKSLFEDGQMFYNKADGYLYKLENDEFVPIGGVDIQVDSELSLTSANPVQNKVITEHINDIEGDITSIQGDITDVQGDIANVRGTTVRKYSVSTSDWDTEPTRNSTKPVTSGGIFNSEQEIREIAEGKCNTFVLSDKITRIDNSGIYYLDENNVEQFHDSTVIGNPINYFFIYNPETKEWENKIANLRNGDYDGLLLANRNFDSQNDSINVDYGIDEDKYIVCGAGGPGNAFYLLNATYSPNPISPFPFKRGDIFIVFETDVPDRWAAYGRVGDIWPSDDEKFYKLETGKVDLSLYYTKTEADAKFVDLTTAQTVSGVKTFSNGFKMSEAASSWNFAQASNGYLYLSADVNRYVWGFYTFRSNRNNEISLGDSSYYWKEGFINKITDASGSYSSNNVFNVINATDIANNTLTQEQYDLITNGKPTSIKGEILSTYDTIIFQAHNDGSFIRFNAIGISQYNETKLRAGYINIATKQIYNVSGGILITYSGAVDISNFRNLNGKSIPAYPSSPATPQYLTYNTNNTLSWTSGGTVLYKHEITFTGSGYTLTMFDNNPNSYAGTTVDSDFAAIINNSISCIFGTTTKVISANAGTTQFSIAYLTWAGNAPQISSIPISDSSVGTDTVTPL